MINHPRAFCSPTPSTETGQLQKRPPLIEAEVDGLHKRHAPVFANPFRLAVHWVATFIDSITMLSQLLAQTQQLLGVLVGDLRAVGLAD
jgi:hypothetical protein